MDSVAGIIEAVGHLPVMLQIFFIVVFSIAFFVLLFFGFGKNSKKWKGLIHLVREHTEMKDEQVSMFKEMPLSFDLKSKSDDIDREARMRIFRRARSIIFTLLSDYQDSCPLIVWNLRSELENEFRQYIFENHLIKKSFKSSAESEKRRIETTVKEVYEQVVLAAKSAPCDRSQKPVKAPDWSVIEKLLIRFIDNFFEILREEIKGACNEKIMLYKNASLEIKNEKIIELICNKPIKKNREYLNRIG